MTFSIATWNVNSLNVRLPGLLEWLGRRAPAVVALQETKLEDAKFPHAALEAAGYRCAFSGQKAYNGVALLARAPLEITDAAAGLPGFADEQKRILAATIGGVRVVNLYVPNGQEVGSDKYRYKLGWLAALTDWLRAELAKHERLVVLGDFNIAPEEADVHDPKAWAGRVLFSGPERRAFRELAGLGLVDGFRRFPQPPKSFTWWDYRTNAFPKNQGLRIDHILLSPGLAPRLVACAIDLEPRRGERPSDHTPVVATFSDGPGESGDAAPA